MLLRALVLAAAVASVASNPEYSVAGIQLVRTYNAGSTVGYVVRVITVGVVFTENRAWTTLQVKVGNDNNIQIRKPTSSVLSGLYGYWDTDKMLLQPGTIVTAQVATSSFSRTVPQAPDPRVVDGVILANGTFAFLAKSAPMNVSTWVAVCDTGIGNRVTVRPGQAVPADTTACDVTAVYDRQESEISPPLRLVLKSNSAERFKDRPARGAMLLTSLFVVFWTFL